VRPVVHQLQRIASIGQIVAMPLLFGLLLIYTYVPGGRRTLRSQLPGAGLNAELLPKGFSPGGEAVRKADRWGRGRRHFPK